MQKWEYRVEMVSFVSCSESTLDELGEKGWELVGMYKEDGFWYAVLKRPL